MGVLQEEDLVLFGMSVLVFPKKRFLCFCKFPNFQPTPTSLCRKKNATSMGMFH